MPEKLSHLNSAQKAAVTFGDGPLLIVAGAGTGKTTVITERIAYLINEKKCQPEEILALTFTDKAAGEMAERVDKILPLGYVDLWISTFHAFAEKILKLHGLEIGLPNDFKMLSTTEQWLLVRQNLDKFPLDYYRPLGNPTKFIHALLKHFSRAKDENISPEKYLAYVGDLKMNTDSAEFIRTVADAETLKGLSKKEIKEIAATEIKKQTEIAEAYHVYQNLLIENNALDFGDLISYTLRLFQARPNILLRYRQQFKAILVDEFQDTNYAQYELIKLLAAPKNNITVVGDDDQSIYKFRGASIANILQFKNDYPKTKEIFLTENYRSRQNILDLSYDFIQQNNPYRLEVKLAKTDGLSKKLKAQAAGKGEINHLHGENLEKEVRLTVEKIGTLYEAAKETNWSDFCILVRANSSATNFTYALEQAGIPYNFIASKGLYGKKIVLDLIAYLKLLDDYRESTALYRLMSLPIWEIPTTEIINLNYWARRKGWSLYETIKQAPTLQINETIQKKLNIITASIEKHSQLAREGKKTTEIIQSFLEESGYLKALTNTDSAANREQITYLNQFFKKIRNFETATADNGVKNFLQLIDLELESGEEGSIDTNWEEEGPDSVKVMTIHAAKGLEFKYVFIVNMVDQRFPTIARGDAIELPEKLVTEITAEGDIHLQEERRLFYVAMTRAKDGLYFTSAEDYGGARKKKISRFLTELNKKIFVLSPKAKAEKNTITSGKKILSKKEAKKTTVAVPAKFSFTQLQTFETCPYKYRFANVLKIPTRGKPQFSFGRSMHSTLQKIFQIINEKNQATQGDLFGEKKSAPAKIDWETATKIYDQSFIDDWYPSRRERDAYYNKGKKILKNFFEKHQGHWPQTLYLEYPFNLRLKHDGVNYTCSGVIDRIDVVSKKVKIIDYKTGSAKIKLSSEDKEQLLIYQMAAQEVLRQEVGELAFYYLEAGQEISFLGEEKELAKLKEKIVGIIEEIQTGDFPPKPEKNACQWCDFNSICEFRA